MNFCDIRKKLIEKDFGRMNDRQFEAVTTVNGPLLVLAGAGSGKTTVLVNRIANLCKYGDGYNSDFEPFYSAEDIDNALCYLEGKTDKLNSDIWSVDAPKPWEILAITFTNKAAGELKDRISAKLGENANDIWAGTFHSVCGKILRRNAEVIGYSSHFTIYDTDDQKRLMKSIMKNNGIEEKMFPVRSVLNNISSAKDSLISPEEYEKSIGNDPRLKTVAKLYKLYSNELKSNDAMDFDDMINNTVELFKKDEEILNYYGHKFRYIMVDEYQDTNHAQYVLVSMLASVHGNICVVGDDDQSIYRFRGATIENILSFEDEYNNAKVIRLEQNYRSTGNILAAANEVIKNNKGRKGKTLWTDKGDGELIDLHTAFDERDEAKYVAEKILEDVRNGGKFSENAVLYRMNAQSAAIENAFARSGISYSVIGGNRFYDRKEIRDVLAYLHLINNKNDNLRLKRIINEPKRGIGDTTVNNASSISEQCGISLFEVLDNAEDYPTISRSAAKLKEFCNMINDLLEKSEILSISELYDEVLQKTGYLDMLLIDTDPKSAERAENVKELGSTVKVFEQDTDEPTLSAFLEEIALVSDIDSLDENADKSVMMTVHSAKGLEFKNVYLVGMEESIFPGSQTIYGGMEEMEEERRLAYVAITRAKKKLYITNAATRMLYGSTTRNLPSRFLSEIPKDYLLETAKVNSQSGYSSGYGSRSSYGGYKDDYAFNESAFDRTPKTKITSSFSAASSKPSAPQVEYTAGMSVSHKTFGEGMIVKVTKMSNDTLLEIAFNDVGTKKIMANYAKLTVL
ncbi:MAG: UvrD-helicase domain-containing protein [Clostridia bacterium]|nr:UvrD-helicase domain-containing protein [Clostridia bacterium]